MKCCGNCRLFAWFGRRWYFTFPGLGVVLGTLQLLTRQDQLSVLPVAASLGIMALFTTVSCAAIFLAMEVLARIIERLRK